eukprot:jgi/Botrbrau1/19381/Bobra.0338s0011.1
MEQLLRKEMQLLQAVDRMDNAVQEQQAGERRTDLLTRRAAARTWPLRTGATIKVETPETARATQILALYEGLQTRIQTPNQRLELLLLLKQFARDMKSELARELVNLIEREAALRSRDRDTRTLDGLCQRILSVFFRLVQESHMTPRYPTLLLGKVLAKCDNCQPALPQGSACFGKLVSAVQAC